MADRPRNGPATNNFAVVRSAVLGLSKVIFFYFGSALAAPLITTEIPGHAGHEEPEVDDPGTWILFVASAILVLTGGAFAGLTIALMGQDSIYLQVVSKDPQEPQQKNAKRVYDLMNKGKHWVLVTLLLSNVIVNESLPVVLDRCLGGGVAAVVGSTVLIVIFGEILPQSVCVRYGLQIGGYMSKPVLMLMYIMAPVAWPTAKLLDWLLGEDHGTVYKKSGLKTLVTLHKSLGHVSERLNQDEVTIISAVLDLKAKPVEAVMTPMDDVFTLPEDAILDEKTMNRILLAGYSRVPIHEPGKPLNFVGMLLVRILITYDPEDCKRVSEFSLATLPETRPETSCLDIINFFQEGKSHMVLVSENPGEPLGALGVVTLEDVIEELIGEEIIDESDVYIDIHKAIRRLTPAPKARPSRKDGTGLNHNHFGSFAIDDGVRDPNKPRAGSLSANSETSHDGSVPKAATFMMRRSSAGADGRVVQTSVPMRKNFDQIKEHLKHLGPSNRASNPKTTKYTAVKIKQVPMGAAPADNPLIGASSLGGQRSIPPPTTTITEDVANEEGEDETSGLLARATSTSHPGVKDGVQAVRQSYGSIDASEAQNRAAGVIAPFAPGPITPTIVLDAASPRTGGMLPYEHEDHSTQTTVESPTRRSSSDSTGSSQSPKEPQSPSQGKSQGQNRLHHRSRRHFVRSGSITENVVEAGGIRKMVLDVEGNSDDDRGEGSSHGHHNGGDRTPKKNHSRTNSLLGSIIGRGKADEDDDGVSDAGTLTTMESRGGGESDAGEGGAGPSTGGDGAAGGSENKKPPGQGKKKNRRKKRKGGK